ncbi:MAG: ribulose-phosphate 3-epimerase [Bacteroidales bacterium]|nr:ribulose-phosphate 3-epimerase [Bacteroidales bacterium]
MNLIAPSLLSANFLHLEADIQMVNQSKAHFFHVDVMDGMFVPNISFGFSIIKQIKSIATKPLDVHLMIEKPERYIDEFKKAGADWLSFQLEASTHAHRSIYAIKEAGMKAGIALNPHSSVNLLENVIQDLDLVLIMSVNPGFGGQKFIPAALKKISQAKEMILKSNSKALIEVDGGVDKHTAPDILKAGADVLVAGSYVFGSENPSQTIAQLAEL